MKTLSGYLKNALLLIFLLFCTAAAIAQTKVARDSREYKNFLKIVTRAGATFTLPDEFKELSLTENSNYNYGIALPGKEFQIWFKITPAAENTPDSLYLDIGKNVARALAGDDNLLVRQLPDRILSDYNADAGRTYFISLPEAPGTMHFKYALLITLQKSHKGNITAVCLTNDKGPDFFKNINKASNCIKFKGGS